MTEARDQHRTHSEQHGAGSTSLAAARNYLARGYQPVPIPRGEKGPRLKDWPKFRPAPKDLSKHFHDGSGIGLLLGDPSGGLSDADLDSAEALALADDFLPKTEMIHGRKSKPRSHWWYLTQPTPRPAKFTDVDGTCLIELRSNAQQTMVPPSTHPSGEVLKWDSDGKPAAVEGITLSRAVHLIAAAAICSRHWPKVGSRHEASLALCGLLIRAGWIEEEVARFVAAVARAADDEQWQSRGKNAITTARKLDKGEGVTAKKRLGEIIGVGVVTLVVKWLGLGGRREAERVFDSTEDGLALTFVDAHLYDLRYTAAWHRWHRWDGTRWVEDITVKVFDLARETCRKAAAGDPKREKVLKTAHTVASVVTLASSDQRISVVPDSWDADRWLLNTPRGLVDLRTGELRTHDPTARITKVTAVGPAGDCPSWKKHIELVTAQNRELAEYLQRFAGYILTGETNEEALAFFHGTGQNGKDTFVTTLQLVLGDYARSAPMSTFTESKNERHPTDLAGLKGARLAIASETGGGSRWDEERIKLLTGGSVVTARFMRGDFFDYVPEFKLWIMGNHKPSLRHVDVAIRRRLHLIPFTVTIESPDKNFKAKLRPEWPGILQWAIEGCLAWQRLGLSPPPAVIDATEEYFAEQDTLGRWLTERCELDPNAQTGSTEAYADWKLWTETRKEHTGPQKAFTQMLKERGFKQKKDNTMFFVGFRLGES